MNIYVSKPSPGHEAFEWDSQKIPTRLSVFISSENVGSGVSHPLFRKLPRLPSLVIVMLLPVPLSLILPLAS